MEIIWEWNTIISLHVLSGMNLVLSLETTWCSLKRGDRFKNCTKFCFFLLYRVIFCASFSHWMLCKQISEMKTNNNFCSLAVRPPSQTVSSWFDTKSFRYKSFHYNSKSIRWPSKVDSMQTEVTIHYKTVRYMYLTVWNYYRISMPRIAKR